jgi:hypothetical protein
VPAQGLLHREDLVNSTYYHYYYYYSHQEDLHQKHNYYHEWKQDLLYSIMKFLREDLKQFNLLLKENGFELWH